MPWFRKQGLPLSLVVNLDVPDEVILARISDRWVHLPSGRVYNLSYNRPRVDGLDDETGERLTKRPDDNPVRVELVEEQIRIVPDMIFQEVFARRLQQFYASTSPLLRYYGSPHTSLSTTSQPKLVSLRGTSSDEIWPMLEHAVRSIAPSLRERSEERKRASLSEALLGRNDERRLHRPRMQSGREH